jgi:hypothetical protein
VASSAVSLPPGNAFTTGSWLSDVTLCCSPRSVWMRQSRKMSSKT